MKKIVALLMGLMLLSSCRSVSYDDLNPTIQPNDNLLPVLEIRPDYASIRAVYTSKRDERVADAVNIFTKEVRENIMQQTGEKKGNITMRISYGKTNHNKIYEITSGFLYIPTLLGVPYYNAEQILEVEVLIQNKHKDVIRRYTESVSNTEYAAMYWGYKKEDVDRKVAARNMRNAMENIRHRINNDAPQIRVELK